MIARACLAIGLLAALPGAALSAGQPTAPAPLHPRNQPPPRSVLPPPPADFSDISGPGLGVFRIPPQAIYPSAALRAELRGRCIVTFTVDAEGVPQDIVPDCTDPVFTAAARDAIAAARLKTDAGITPGQTIRLPLRFAIEDDDLPQE